MSYKNKFFNDKRHLSEISVALIVDELRGKRIPDLSAEVNSHLDECPFCKEIIVETWSFTSPDLKTGNSVIIDTKDFEEKIIIKKSGTKITYVRAAASFLITALIFLTFLFMRENKTRKYIVDTKGLKNDYPIDKSNTNNEIPATNHDKRSVKSRFESNPNLESMIGTAERGDFFNSSGFGVTIVPDEMISFELGEITGKIKNLDILDNRNNTIYSFSVDGGKFKLKKRFRPGLYYWKVSDDKHLIFVGKFKIGKISLTE